MKALVDNGFVESQSLRNQGFIRTRWRRRRTSTISVSIPSKSGFHSNGRKFHVGLFPKVSIPSKSGFHSNQFGPIWVPDPASLNPFEIRVSFEPVRWTGSVENFGLNPFEIRVSFEPSWCWGEARYVLSQSLRNQGFIRTGCHHGNRGRRDVSIPSKSGFHSNRFNLFGSLMLLGLNPFEIRVSFEPRDFFSYAETYGLNPFEIRVSFEPLRRSTVSRC